MAFESGLGNRIIATIEEGVVKVLDAGVRAKAGAGALVLTAAVAFSSTVDASPAGAWVPEEPTTTTTTPNTSSTSPSSTTTTTEATSDSAPETTTTTAPEEETEDTTPETDSQESNEENQEDDEADSEAEQPTAQEAKELLEQVNHDATVQLHVKKSNELIKKLQAEGMTAAEARAEVAKIEDQIFIEAKREVEAASTRFLASKIQTVADLPESLKYVANAHVTMLTGSGASESSAEHVVVENLKVRFGAERAEIVGERADGACILSTYEGKRVEEFTRTALAEASTPEAAKKAILEGICDKDGGVNVPAVASFMAKIEAMKNGVDINTDFDKVYGKMAQKYADAMAKNPQVAQAYLGTVQEFINNAKFDTPKSIAGTTDRSVYVAEDGTIYTLTVTNKDGAVSTRVEYTLVVDGRTVVMSQDIKGCAQPALTVVAEQPAPEAPAAPPATPVSEKPPTPEVFEATAQVCTGLDGSGNEILETFIGHGETEEEAQENAQLAASIAAGNCTPSETTTTTTSSTSSTTSTTTTPSTTTTTSTTTAPSTSTTEATTTTATSEPKNCIDNPESCATTSVPGSTTEITPPPTTRPPATIQQDGTSTSIVELAGSAMAFSVENPGGTAATAFIPGSVALAVLADRRKKKSKSNKTQL